MCFFLVVPFAILLLSVCLSVWLAALLCVSTLFIPYFFTCFLSERASVHACLCTCVLCTSLLFIGGKREERITHIHTHTERERETATVPNSIHRQPGLQRDSTATHSAPIYQLTPPLRSNRHIPQNTPQAQAQGQAPQGTTRHKAQGTRHKPTDDPRSATRRRVPIDPTRHARQDNPFSIPAALSPPPFLPFPPPDHEPNRLIVRWSVRSSALSLV